MINVSNAFRRELANDRRNYLMYADITLSDGTELNLTNENFWQGGVTIEDSVSESDTFTIGGAVINKLTLVINNIYDEFSDYDFTGAEIIVRAGLKLPDNTIESFRKGFFTVDEAKYNGSIITLSCLDNMSKFDTPYSESTLAYPATLAEIVRDACTKCDVTLQSYTFPHSDYTVQSRPDDEATTFREIISWCAQIACCYARCDTLGRLVLDWYNTSVFESEDKLDGGRFDSSNPYASGDTADGGTFNPWSNGDDYDGDDFDNLKNFHHIYSNYSVDIATDDVVITGVKVVVPVESEESSNEYATYQTGTNGYVISVEGNDLIQGEDGATIAGWIGTALIGLRFRSGSVSHSSDPTIEAGDIAYLTTRKQNSYPFLVSYTKFSNGSSQTTECIAETPARNSATRFSASTKNYVEFRKNLKQQKTQFEEALDELDQRIENSSGLFTTEEEQPNGSIIFYMHDKPTLAESQIVWQMTAEAWGVSTDGGKTFNAGMTVDGDTITRILTATGVNADWITTGKISSVNGRVYFDLDNSELRCSHLVSENTGAGEDMNAIIGRSFFGGATETSGYQNIGFTVHKTNLSRYGVALSPGDENIMPGVYSGANGMTYASYVRNGDGGMAGISITQKGFLVLSSHHPYSEAQDILSNTWAESNYSNSRMGNIIIAPRYNVDGSVYNGWGVIYINGNADFRNGIEAASLTVTGIKNRSITTDNYGDRLQYCYEMPSPMFGDIGEAVTDENGECIINIDDIFSETVSTNIEYQVFLQKEGSGDIWVSEKNENYFVIQGTANLKFSWEIKAKQKDYEYERLETKRSPYSFDLITPEIMYEMELNQLIQEQEVALYETIK